MRMKSTGLGKTELVGRLEDIKTHDHHLILSVRTTSPVKWHIRVAVDYKDLRITLRQLFKFSLLKYLFLSLIIRKEPEPPSDY